MALLFSHVRVSTPGGNEAEFFVSGIPREFEDFDYYTKFEDFLDCIEEDTEITVWTVVCTIAENEKRYQAARNAGLAMKREHILPNEKAVDISLYRQKS